MGHFVVCAASLGPRIHVTAVDINPSAVENVNMNAARHGVQDRVSCSVGDVYRAPVTAGKTFDIIFWDPPFSRGEISLREHTQLERAVWDPGYDSTLAISGGQGDEMSLTIDELSPTLIYRKRSPILSLLEMSTLVLAPFALLFSHRIWLHAQVLFLEAMLPPSACTATAALQVMGLTAERHFTHDHRVLNQPTKGVGCCWDY